MSDKESYKDHLEPWKPFVGLELIGSLEGDWFLSVCGISYSYWHKDSMDFLEAESVSFELDSYLLHLTSPEGP